MEHNYLIPNIALTAPDKEQELAILFVDIRNFTGLMAAQPGQTMIQVVRRLFTAFNQVIKNFEGKVVEMAGDSIYAVFGLQTNIKEAVNQAYQATRLMFQTVGLFNDAYTEPFDGGPLEIGVGLHAGKVFVGEFGLDNAPQLSVMGLPVNIAARLQAKTKDLDNDLLISEYAYQYISPATEDAGLLNVALQGIEQQQQVRLAGKSYRNQKYLSSPKQNMDYLLAISG